MEAPIGVVKVEKKRAKAVIMESSKIRKRRGKRREKSA